MLVSFFLFESVKMDLKKEMQKLFSLFPKVCMSIKIGIPCNIVKL
jgi:hypothetical protein